MEDDKLKYQIGLNIATYRKRAGMTQAGMAELLNYSDKAVSKWERGESVPDVLTLAALAQRLGVTVNDLLADPKEAEKVLEPEKPRKKANRRVIQCLSSLLVWFVALFVYVVLPTVVAPYSWLVFCYAVPINAIVLLSLRSAWKKFSWNKWLISVIMWGCLGSIYLTVVLFSQYRPWKIFLLGIPGQAAILLWFHMFFPVKNEEPKEK